jgi:glutamine amidotransferase
MCRLLGIYGEVNFWQKIVLEFSKLAESGNVPSGLFEPGHKDGWGMAASNAGKTVMIEIIRRLGSAYHSSIFKETIQSIKNQPHAFLCHLRKASPDVPITMGNVHPFFKKGWAFAHNGTIYDPETLPRNPSFKFTSNGSDSEHLFYFLLSTLLNEQKSKNILKVISDAISFLTTHYTAINCIFGNGRELYVIRDYNEFRDYYTLYYYHLEKGLIICSEPLGMKELDRNKWQELPNQSILRIHGTPPDSELFSYY